jgi:hypothetical protein
MSLLAQTMGTVQGTVTDPSGAVIPGADVILFRGTQQVRKVSSNEVGQFQLTAPVGQYALRVVSVGFTTYEFRQINVSNTPLNVTAQLKLASENIQVEVNEEVQGVSTEAGDNLGQLTLRGDDLNSLSDNPEDLEQELQALAGPSAGPNGAQFFIDGFSGGRLPPKSAIREIRINQNPYAAEFDRLGFGRIEIFTKPGADQWRGSVNVSFADNALNARNPFLTQGDKPPFQQRSYGFNFGGPVNKRSSFNIDVDRRETDESPLINATILDSSFNIVPFSGSIESPRRVWTVNPRYDYAINSKNTLIARYQGDFTTDDNNGVQNFSLASRAFDSRAQNHSFQISETAVLSPTTINELRFQFIWSRSSQDDPNPNVPSIVVQDGFNGGGSQVGNAFSRDRRFEIQDFISIVKGKHSYKFGGRVRLVNQEDNSPANYGGTFTFGSGIAPQLDANLNIIPNAAPIQLSPIQRYQRAQLLLSRGFSGADLALRGAAPSQFSITTGQPLLGIDQYDLGLFAQDDWRVRPNLTLSYGIRYEGQNNIGDNANIAPRVGVAWGVGQKGNQAAKTVLRFNAGMFYDRFSENSVLTARRLNGSVQTQYVLSESRVPGSTSPILFYPNVPPIGQIAQIATVAAQAIRQIDPDLRAPTLFQSSISFERALPKSSSLSVVFINTRGWHVLRTRNINAPIPGLGLRPFGNAAGNILNFESTGITNQRQILAFLRSGTFNVPGQFSPVKSFSMFGFYSWGQNNSDSDGLGSQPADPYDLSTEYGRAAFDIRHRFNMFPMVSLPWKLRINPLMSYSSGGAFNITTGRDNNGDLSFLDRPAVTSDASRPGVRSYNGQLLDPNPAAGTASIRRNSGQSPSFFQMNLRLSRTFGFGPVVEQGNRGGGGGFPGGFGGGRPRGGGGGPRGGSGGPMGFDGGSTNRRYNLIFSLSVNNLLNTVNPGVPNGNLTSPFFNQSLSLASFGGFRPGGGGGGFGGGGQASNRNLQMQLRFQF